MDRQMIEITVNCADGIEHQHNQPCETSERFVSDSVRSAIDNAMEKFPDWTSMVVVFVRP